MCLPAPVLRRIWPRDGEHRSPDSTRMAFLALDMEQPARVSGAADRPPRSDQGDVPRSSAHTSQVATSVVVCRRFYLCLHQVCFHGKPTDQGTRKVTCLLGLRLRQWQKAQQLFIPPVISHPGELPSVSVPPISIVMYCSL
jgi:hypothetical protein